MLHTSITEKAQHLKYAFQSFFISWLLQFHQNINKEFSWSQVREMSNISWDTAAHTHQLHFLFPFLCKGERNKRYELMVAFEAGKSGALWEAFHPPSGELLSDKSADALCTLWP